MHMREMEKTAEGNCRVPTPAQCYSREELDCLQKAHVWMVASARSLQLEELLSSSINMGKSILDCA